MSNPSSPPVDPLAERPPYSPSFSSQPPVLAGRQEIVESLEAGLLAGPRDPEFGRLLFGDRGMGKTVLVDALGERMRTAHGWLVVDLAIKARQDPIAAALLQLQDAISDTAKVRTAWKALDKELSVELGVPHVARLRASIGTRRQSDKLQDIVHQLERTLDVAGRHAGTAGCGILLTFDELHNARSKDLQALGNIFSMTKRHRLPIGLIGAGLPEFDDVLARAKATFFERMHSFDVGPLTFDAAMRAIKEPAEERGVRIAPDAMNEMLRKSGGHPYLLQLAGWSAWKAAGHGTVITLAHVHESEHIARSHFERLIVVRWRSLSQMEQRYLYAMAMVSGGCDSPVQVGDVAKSLNKTLQDLSYVRDSLLSRHHLISAPRHGYVAPTLPGFSKWVAASGDCDLNAPLRPGPRARKITATTQD